MKNNNNKERKIFLIKSLSYLAILALISGFSLFSSSSADLDSSVWPAGGQSRMAAAAEKPASEESQQTAAPLSPFEDLELESRAAIVWDLQSQKSIFELNADEPRPLASLAKILLAYTALQILPDNTEINIEREFLEARGDTGLRPAERWRFRDLLEFSLLTSSNDGARAIASTAGAWQLGSDDYPTGREQFVAQANDLAARLGLTSMVLKNETGLDEDQAPGGGLGSARHFAKLLELFLIERPEILAVTSEPRKEFISLSGIRHQVENTNVRANALPGLMASKTGYTDRAGGNLAVIFDSGPGRPLAVVVLSSTFEGRFRDIEKLIGAARKHFLMTEV